MTCALLKCSEYDSFEEHSEICCYSLKTLMKSDYIWYRFDIMTMHSRYIFQYYPGNLTCDLLHCYRYALPVQLQSFNSAFCLLGVFVWPVSHKHVLSSCRRRVQFYWINASDFLLAISRCMQNRHGFTAEQIRSPNPLRAWPVRGL